MCVKWRRGCGARGCPGRRAARTTEPPPPVPRPPARAGEGRDRRQDQGGQGQRINGRARRLPLLLCSGRRPPGRVPPRRLAAALHAERRSLLRHDYPVNTLRNGRRKEHARARTRRLTRRLLRRRHRHQPPRRLIRVNRPRRPRRAAPPPPSVVEEPQLVVRHDHAVVLRGARHFVVLHGAARLRDKGDAELGGVVDRVAEGEEGVRGERDAG